MTREHETGTEAGVQIGYHSNIRSNLHWLLQSSNVQVRMADGRMATAQSTCKWDACWVWFDKDTGKEILWSRVEKEVAEITGLICKRCKRVLRVKRLFLGSCEECRKEGTK